MTGSSPDFAHSASSTNHRREKALTLARFMWDRGVTADELAKMTDEQLRKLARGAGVNPPSSRETWNVTSELLVAKTAWALSHPDHPAAARDKLDEKIMWVKPPVKPWS